MSSPKTATEDRPTKSPTAPRPRPEIPILPKSPSPPSKDERKPGPTVDSLDPPAAKDTPPKEEQKGDKLDVPKAPAQDSDDGGGIIGWETFDQILELDDEDDKVREFSRGMVWAFFDQAENTFDEMDKALKDKDLEKLSSLGHFLKGSSAALGVIKVQESCEKIQHYGQRRDEEKGEDLSGPEALAKIGTLLVQVKKDYAGAEQWLKGYYDKLPANTDQST